MLELMTHRYRIYIVAFCALIFQASAADAPSFAKRVALAKEVEEQKAAAEYFQNRMYPAIGPSLASAMLECVSRVGASTEKFTVIANVSQDGQLTDIAHEPNTNTAACLTAAMASFRLPPPPTCDYGALPIVIDMSVEP
jgi:hypothetical protein